VLPLLCLCCFSACFLIVSCGWLVRFLPPTLFIAPSQACLCAQANMWRKVLYVILAPTNECCCSGFERLWS
jgi:hypothetical protein